MINLLFASHANEFSLSSEIQVILNNVYVKNEKFTKMSRALLHRYVSHLPSSKYVKKNFAQPLRCYLTFHKTVTLTSRALYLTSFALHHLLNLICRSGRVIGYYRKEVR
jgi:hypothetical protein